MRLFLTLLASCLIINVSFAQDPKPNSQTQSTNLCRCLPHQDCWPSEATWNALSKELHGKLVKPKATLSACHEDPKSVACEVALKNSHNPFYLQSQPGETQSQGWYKAWDAKLSEYAVQAQSTQDVVAAVNFARNHHLRLVIKGGGHDYYGRNNAANSLLIWTHPMREIIVHNDFVPVGCSKKQHSSQAVTVSAGTRWIDAYSEVTTKHNRYVQGGGCASVGAAGGFTQGGGFGSLSKKFGSGAANMLQVEIVSADGKTLIANECQNADLFWAVRGGGGGTFGVVTKMTLKTFDLPSNFGVYKAKITAKTDAHYQKLIKEFLSFYRDNLNNEHWGEQIEFTKDNTIDIMIVFQGLSKEQANNSWQGLQQWLKKEPDGYAFENDVFIIPANKMWDYNFWKENHPDFVTLDPTPGAPIGQYWWKSNTSETSKYWYTYLSRWLPLSLFAESKLDQLAQTLFKASRLAHVSLHVNKGLAGGAKDALARSKQTATNPAAFEAAGLVIIASGSNEVYPSIKGKEIDETKVNKMIQNDQDAYALIKDITPKGGTYLNEADYFEKEWQNSFWGDNYKKLYSIKQKYDPNGLFYCHHCVGSENWDETGMCKDKTS